MAKRNPWIGQQTDREGDAKAIEEFLAKGGKVQRMHDAAEIAAYDKRAARRASLKRKSGVMGGIPLLTRDEALTVKDEE